MNLRTIEQFLKLMAEAWQQAAKTNYSGIQLYEVNWHRGGITRLTRVKQEREEIQPTRNS